MKLLIADADGTLVDTVRLIRHGQYETARRYLLAHGVPSKYVVNFTTYNVYLQQLIGGSAQDTMRRVLEAIYAKTPEILEGIDYARMVALLNEVQDELATTDLSAYEGAEDVFRAIGEAGSALVIATSGTRHHIARNFSIGFPALGLDSATFGYPGTAQHIREVCEAMERVYGISRVGVVTCEDVSAAKPDPEMILAALDFAEVQASDAAMLGDHGVDMQSAQAAGVPMRIGITHGFDDAATLRAAGATVVIDDLTSMAKMVAADGVAGMIGA